MKLALRQLRKGNRPRKGSRIVDDIYFYTTEEAAAYVELKSMHYAGLITNWRLAPKFEVWLDTELIFSLHPLFYYERAGIRIYRICNSLDPLRLKIARIAVGKDCIIELFPDDQKRMDSRFRNQVVKYSKL
jgi:hypothetical protein